MIRKALGITLAALLAALLAGCLPMTFSHEGVIDFEKYPSVYVQPVLVTGQGVFGDGPDSSAQSYLISELRDASGFERVVGEPVNVSAVLVVEVRIDVDYDSEDGTEDYPGTASWYLRTLDGALINEGSASESSTTPQETLEDLLDEVGHHYLRPYRF